MPKRKKKKKADGSELPPLKFVESPLNQSPQILSPDFGAINPVTARAVAIEDIHDLPWVTPQFGKQPHYSRQNQTSRKISQLRKKSESSKYVQNLNDVASKFKPLSFVQNNDRCLRNKRCSRSELEGNILSNHDLNVTKHKDCQPDGVPTDYAVDSFPDRISTPILNRHKLSHDGNSISASSSFSHHRHERNDGEFNINIPSKDSNFTTFHRQIDCDAMQHEGPNPNSNGVSHELSVIFGKTKRPFMFESSSSPPPSPIPQILVSDTPECEYGLTMRQRQLKYFLRSRQK